MVWIVELFEQSTNQTPHIVDKVEFNTKEEAVAFYLRNKRDGGWPWRFWAYPKEVVIKGGAQNDKCRT